MHLYKVIVRLAAVFFSNYNKISAGETAIKLVMILQNHNVKCNGRKHQDSPNVKKRMNEVSRQQIHFISPFLHD